MVFSEWLNVESVLIPGLILLITVSQCRMFVPKLDLYHWLFPSMKTVLHSCRLFAPWVGFILTLFFHECFINVPKNKTTVFLFHTVSVIVRIMLKWKLIHDVSYPTNDPGNTLKAYEAFFFFFLLSMTAEPSYVCPLMESKYPDQRVKMLFFSPRTHY